ncbi:MAG: DegT/DnrJ/EryC1/StrS family aminotransferase, partial [Syntrophomonas sp.]
MIEISGPLLDEEEKSAVLGVLNSGRLAQGTVVREFEEAFAAYCGVKHAVATSSGTTALHLALLAHGIGPGDEVITTPFTFIATLNAIMYVGATPVLADIDPRTFNLDP